MTPRLCNDADIPAVIRLWEACGLTRPWNDPESDIRRCRRSPGCALYLVEDGEGRVIATVMAGADGHRGWLYYLAVAVDFRRRGLGRMLVATAEAWLQQQGMDKAMLMIRADNAAVADFYAALGYHQEPRLLLARWLDGRSNPEAGSANGH